MLERLNENEQRALMELMVYMAKADGRVEEVEAILLEQYAGIFAMDLTELEGDFGPEELAPHFDSPESRIIVLQELLRLAHLNGVFNTDEQSAMLEVASLLGVPLDLLREVETWVVEGIQWTLRGEKLLEKGREVVRVNPSAG